MDYHKRKKGSLIHTLTSKEISPPQQNPAAPIADTPLLSRAATTCLASSNPLSYQKLTKIILQKPFNITVLPRLQNLDNKIMHIQFIRYVESEAYGNRVKWKEVLNLYYRS